MSSTLAPPAPPPTDPTAVGPPPEPTGAPPDTAFAPLLAAAQAPPGPTAKTPTRTAKAEGDQAGSDSSAPTPDPNAAAAAALVNQSLVIAGAVVPQQPPATAPGAPAPAAGAQTAPPPAPTSVAAPAAAPAQPAAPDPTVPTAAGASTQDSVAPTAALAPQADPPAVATTAATDQSAQPATPAATTPAPAVTAAVVAAPAAPAQSAPETPTTAAAPAVTQANDVTSSKTGDDTRRSRDEAGVAEQPSRLAPAADQQAPVQTVAAQDAPATKDVVATPATPQPQTPVRLAELAHAAQTAITVASQNGSTSARITLHPDELGAVQIHLRYGADGVSATVRADSPQAAQILHQAAPDLKRALEGQGLSLLGFDVRDRSGNPADRDQSSSQGGSSNGGGNADPDPDDDLTGPAAIAVDPASLPSPGSQIDVLA